MINEFAGSWFLRPLSLNYMIFWGRLLVTLSWFDCSFHRTPGHVTVTFHAMGFIQTAAADLCRISPFAAHCYGRRLSNYTTHGFQRETCAIFAIRFASFTGIPLITVICPLGFPLTIQTFCIDNPKGSHSFMYIPLSLLLFSLLHAIPSTRLPRHLPSQSLSSSRHIQQVILHNW